MDISLEDILRLVRVRNIFIRQMRSAKAKYFVLMQNFWFLSEEGGTKSFQKAERLLLLPFPFNIFL